MKILFLDFDGVLNSAQHPALPPGGGMMGIAPEHVAVLNAVVEDTGAKVVVSSTWRLGRDALDLQTLLEGAGFTGYVIGRTPDLTRRAGALYAAVQRGHEIQAWMDAWSATMCDDEPIESFAIVDDDDDMGELRGRLVQTDFRTGLQDEHARRLVALLTD